MSRFTAYEPDTAPAAARPVMAGVRRSLGHLPAAVSLMAGSPELLKGFLAANAAFEATDLDPAAREVVVLTVATRNGCHLCVAMHTATLVRHGATPELIEALRTGATLPDPRLEALRRFTVAVLDHRGAVPDADLDALLASGWQRRHALDVVLGVGTYTISTFANRLTEAPLDEPLAAYAWQPAPC
ncbi:MULTISPECIES: carboxymuconolactone decarboxylase family protein [unclassified Micromonospora]|uniref:carboxymuconolactone decarboxylase family protein n=1 Tax=unclassified Micromonospora TaxID=2617518 RepID=UPI0018908B0B|nr:MULTISPECIES: carboxymuconolactone decarboxylase family protein [unclassified Micromonospora]MBF5032357.1 carboxymuconolactone decarboxylase family protein [Micromonospora sp. ANENR4]MCZ7478683.1 carboxymuconolactone decarboxylase family protein [Micromonospora sp. WMMC273]WBC03363.1 carboxymuconolactone decarboxylase family protein [Micromonospora sp. WMMA1976]